MSAKLFVFLALVAITIQLSTIVEARSAPPMTRIQEVFRSLMGPEEVRGKKYYPQFGDYADNQYFSEW